MKPPYRVPSMTEIAALPPNGFTAVSTFSGCGGSSLGYKMAGFNVAWANEFIPAAQEVYRLNHPTTILDTRDIRTVAGADILNAIGKAQGEIDLFDGSPPCASFSTAGKREKGWGDVKAYSDTKQRTDDLFFEYARLIRELQPKTFVAENVKGLVIGKAKGYFLEILRTLRACGYRVEAKLLDARWLGVPQMRQRLIFVGVREDIGLDPVFPKPQQHFYSVADAWAAPMEQEAHRSFKESKLYPFWLTCDARGSHETRFSLRRLKWHLPAPTLCASMSSGSGSAGLTHPDVPRYPTIPELKRISGFPDDFKLTGDYGRQWERLGRAVPPVMMSHVAATLRDEVLCKIQ